MLQREVDVGHYNLHGRERWHDPGDVAQRADDEESVEQHREQVEEQIPDAEQRREAEEEQQVDGRLDLKLEEEPLGDEIPVKRAELAHGIARSAELGPLERSPHALERYDATLATTGLNAARRRREALEGFQALRELRLRARWRR